MLNLRNAANDFHLRNTECLIQMSACEFAKPLADCPVALSLLRTVLCMLRGAVGCGAEELGYSHIKEYLLHSVGLHKHGVISSAT